MPLRLKAPSPGGFPPLVTSENIYDMPQPRNPHLFAALFFLDFIKCANEGTRRMRDSMIASNLPKPEFEQKDINFGLVRVTLRLVPPRLLRRRYAARLRAERGVPYRLHSSVVGRHLGRGRHSPRCPRDGRCRTVPHTARRRSHHALHAAVGPGRARPRLHQWVRAGRARERRAVHARRGLDGHRLRDAGRRRPTTFRSETTARDTPCASCSACASRRRACGRARTRVHTVRRSQAKDALAER
jgi:hypothetical protein